MSHITDVILITATGDSGDLAGLREMAPNLQKAGESAGPWAMQCDVYVAAVNYLDEQGFVRVFASIKWDWPESAQLLMKGEHEDVFTFRAPKP